jgi:hypothetical protein
LLVHEETIWRYFRVGFDEGPETRVSRYSIKFTANVPPNTTPATHAPRGNMFTCAFVPVFLSSDIRLSTNYGVSLFMPILRAKT